MLWRPGAGVLAAALCLLAPHAVEAYEFEVRARTIGQGSTLRALGLGANTSVLHRRRITQSLSLHLWDLVGTRNAFERWNPTRAKGPRIYLTSYVRLDQEQGNFVDGTLLLDGRSRDVIDVIPELERSALGLDVLYAFVGAEGLFDERLDVFIGRQMDVQTLDWFSFDGLRLRGHLPIPITVEGFGGLRVRERSFAASDAFTPDGSSIARCEEFVEGQTAGSGSWRPIDGLPVAENGRFSSDDEICPQQEQRMPTFGAAVSTDGLKRVVARASYRRSHSGSPGLLGEVDRLDTRDEGYYPFERELAQTGVTEERLALSVRGFLRPSKSIRVMPYAAARYSLLHGLVDEAHAGTRLSWRSHRLESELFYSVPTFDGDSIFNVFSVEPYTDARLTWRVTPKTSPWSGYLRGWGRQYQSEDEPSDTGAMAGGAQGGLRFGSGGNEARFDGYAEGGYGGPRIGGALSGGTWIDRQWQVYGRASLIRYEQDARSEAMRTNAGLQLGTRYQVHRGFAASLLLEQNANPFALAVFAVVDLAFQPKT